MIQQKWVALILAVMLVAPIAVAQDAKPAPAAAELTQLLREFLAGAATRVDVHERFWADDLIYTGASGRRIGKADILKDVKGAPPPQADDPKVTYEAEDIRIQQYGETAVVAFRLVQRTEGEGRVEVNRFLNTGTFVRRNGKWQAVAWQATKAQPPAETTK